jgi:hypothetical protein
MQVIRLRSLMYLCVLVPVLAGAGQSGSGRSAQPTAQPPLEQVYANFRTPPPGYGEVAFYWWLGDTLTRERILWQLDQLKGKGVVGLQVNYAHSDSGGLIWGLTFPSQPKLFSEEWWELFGWFLGEAKKRGMAVSLSDYTLGIGQGSYVDEALADHPELNGSELRFEKKIIPGSEPVIWKLPGEALSVNAYQVGKDSLPLPGTERSLAAFVTAHELKWTPGQGAWMISCVWAERIVPSYDPMHANAGKVYIGKFFQRFADRFPGEPGKGINYFFSDELSFRLQYPIWDDAFAQEFIRRKGYDIRSHLSALFVDVGDETPRIRLDYNDVMMSLSEENYFRPLYQWHQDRGMTFGCDHGGRGRDVSEFGDYFRAVRWNQGPGCDQPMLRHDVIKNKVASSIAHLYERPRVWLEGFHSSGWSTSAAQITDAIFGNFIMGQNLLTFHGLYYSTHGGWWEWAPPDNHFRMPYWQHIDPLMGAVQRLSYLLTQGKHRCDVALLYPVEPVIAGTAGQASVDTAFAYGEALYNAGIDFDFIDYESLARATVRKGKLLVSGEEYRVLVLPSMKTIRFASIAKARDLVASGGTVVNVGSRPEASERGRGNPEFASICLQLLGKTTARKTNVSLLQTARRGGRTYQCDDKDSLVALVTWLFPRDFAVVDPRSLALPSAKREAAQIQKSEFDRGVRVMHRRIGASDIYAVYNLPQGTECFFRSKGKAELWDPWTGERRPLCLARSVAGGTILPLPLSRYDVQLIIFTPGESTTSVLSSTLRVVDSVKVKNGKITLWGETGTAGTAEARVRHQGKTYALSGDVQPACDARSLAGGWEFEVQPALDNRWGDFHWPPTATLIGPEVRRLAYSAVSLSAPRSSLPSPAAYTDTVSCTFGPQFWKLGPLPRVVPIDTLPGGRGIDPSAIVTCDGKTYRWQPYQFSWRWGVENDPGHQGYHGLKEEVHDDFIRLGKMVHGWTTIERQAEEGGTYYCLLTGVIAPHDGAFEIEQGRVPPAAIRINGAAVDTAAHTVHLKAGPNTLLLWYDKPCVTYFVLRKQGNTASLSGALKQATIGKPLAMQWYRDTSLLPFDARFAEAKPEGWYHFTSAPGLKRMHVIAHGALEAYVGGTQVRLTKGLTDKDGAAEYLMDLDPVVAAPVDVALHIKHQRGYYGGAAFTDPIRLECEKGVFDVGDWSKNDGLYAYSGGAWYRKAIHLTADELRHKVELDLGSVVTTAEVRINGRKCGVRVAPPWVFDITSLVHAGENAVEILVYNTAANHYASIPTRYRGSLTSGLFGPVRLQFTAHAILKNQ